jgi:hypothetical protein
MAPIDNLDIGGGARPGGNPNLQQLMGSDQFRVWYYQLDGNGGQPNIAYWDSLTNEQKAAKIDEINATNAIPGYPNQTRQPGIMNTADRLAAMATRNAKERFTTVPELGVGGAANPYAGYGYTDYGYGGGGGGAGSYAANWLTNLTNWNIT